MNKTPTMEKLEAQRQTEIGQLVRDALDRHRGDKNMVMLVALDLGVTDATVYNWCGRLRIDVEDYRLQKSEEELFGSDGVDGTQEAEG